MKTSKITNGAEIVADVLCISVSIFATLYGFIFAIVGMIIFGYDLFHILMYKKPSFIGRAIKDVLNFIP